jgi:hypothetical protein
MEIVAEVRQLQQERKNYETTKEWKHKPEHPNKDSDAIREHEAALHHATRRCEHYHSWLLPSYFPELSGVVPESWEATWSWIR